MTSYFLKGLIIGFMIAAPVGPINVLCVRRTIVHGRLVGLVSGLGAAAADTLFGCIAAFGFVVIIGWVEHERFWLSLAGALILVAVGTATFMARPPSHAGAPVADPTSLAGDFTSTFFLTLTNPITILSFLALYAGFDIKADDRIGGDDWLLLLGIFAGSSAWWLIVVGLAGWFRDRFTRVEFKWANRIAGAVILTFAVIVAVEAMRLAAGGG